MDDTQPCGPARTHAKPVAPPALIGREAATRREAAAGWRVYQLRHGAGDGLEARFADGRHVDARESTGSSPGYRDGEDLQTAARPSASSTTLPAYITTTRCATSATTPMAWVISMIDMPKRDFHVLQQVQDLRLNRDIKRRRRFVGDQEFWMARQRHRDHHALPHAPGELMRIVVDAALRIRDLNQRQHVDGSLQHGAAAQSFMQRDHLADLVADGVDGIERGHRLLEHDRDFPGADAVHLVRRQRNDDRGPATGSVRRRCVRAASR